MMVGIWHEYFISLDSLKDFLSSFGKGMNNLVSRRFAQSPRWVKGPSRIFIGYGVAYMLVVFGGRFKKEGYRLCSLLTVGLAMLLIQLVLAVLRIYPFSVPRLSLFFTPLLLLVTVMAMGSLRERFKRGGRVFQIIFAAYLIFLSLGIGWDVFIKKDLGAESTLYSTGL